MTADAFDVYKGHFRIHPVELMLGEDRDDDLLEFVDILVGALKKIEAGSEREFEVFTASDGERSIRRKGDILGEIHAIAVRAQRDAWAKANGWHAGE